MGEAKNSFICLIKLFIINLKKKKIKNVASKRRHSVEKLVRRIRRRKNEIITIIIAIIIIIIKTPFSSSLRRSGICYFIALVSNNNDNNKRQRRHRRHQQLSHASFPRQRSYGPAAAEKIGSVDRQAPDAQDSRAMRPNRRRIAHLLLDQFARTENDRDSRSIVARDGATQALRRFQVRASFDRGGRGTNGGRRSGTRGRLHPIPSIQLLHDGFLPQRHPQTLPEPAVVAAADAVVGDRPMAGGSSSRQDARATPPQGAGDQVP